MTTGAEIEDTLFDDLMSAEFSLIDAAEDYLAGHSRDDIEAHCMRAAYDAYVKARTAWIEADDAKIVIPKI